MYLEQEYSFNFIVAALFASYKIIPIGQQIPAEFLTVNGIEKLVEEGHLPREAASFLYNLMCK